MVSYFNYQSAHVVIFSWQAGSDTVKPLYIESQGTMKSIISFIHCFRRYYVRRMQPTIAKRRFCTRMHQYAPGFTPRAPKCTRLVLSWSWSHNATNDSLLQPEKNDRMWLFREEFFRWNTENKVEYETSKPAELTVVSSRDPNPNIKIIVYWKHFDILLRDVSSFDRSKLEISFYCKSVEKFILKWCNVK